MDRVAPFLSIRSTGRHASDPALIVDVASLLRNEVSAMKANIIQLSNANNNYSHKLANNENKQRTTIRICDNVVSLKEAFDELQLGSGKKVVVSKKATKFTRLI